MQTRDKKIEKLTKVENEFNDQVETMRKAFGSQLVDLKRKFEREREAKADAFEKLELMRLEMKALEGKDIKNDLWKDKCKELYEISKELESENDRLRDNYTHIQDEMTDLRRQLSSNMMQMDTQKLLTMRHSGIGQHAWDGESSRDGGPFRITINKPMTATAASKNKRIVSGNAEGPRHA
jgi:hypothetical protein